MVARDEERLAAADQIRRDLAVRNELSRPQARAYVRCLQTTWQVPAIQWSDRESATQLSDARRLLHAAHIFLSVEGVQSNHAIDCFRRTGEILEWLHRSNDNVRSILPIELLAAAAYQLGGLPAMAAGLLDQVQTEHEGVKLYAAFLRADFDGVLQLAGNFWRHHSELTSRDAVAQLYAGVRQESNNDSERSGVSWALTVELVRTLGLTADCLRRGDDNRLAVAIRKLHAFDALATRTFSDDAALVISLVRQVADSYVSATIYRQLRAIATMRPERADKLLAYARDQYSRGRGILWPSQLHGLERLRTESSFALCTPTGSGKTLVANIALIKELLLRDHDSDVAPLALYIVPSRALAGEVEAKLTSELGRDITITGLYGGADWGITDYWLNSAQPVALIATVEKAEALMRYLGPLLTARLRLLIIDEAHQVVPTADDATRVSFADHSNRSIRLESLVSRILAYRPDVIRIALTAVAGGAAGPVARWVEGRADAQPVGVRYRSTRQLIGILETTPRSQGRIQLDLMNGLPLYLRGEEEPVYLPLRIEALPALPATWRNSLNRFNSLSVLWTALHLSEEDQRILISISQEPEQIMRWYTEALKSPDWATAVRFSPPDGLLGTRFEEARAACRDYCGPESFELYLLERGIATSHGQMPQRLRRLMVEMIDKKICPITVATATLTEGVNLPFDVIFLTSLKRRSWNPVTEEPVIVPLTTAEFRNLAGRAGRPGATRGIEGMTLVALPTQVSTTASGMRSTQRRQREELIDDYEALRRGLVIEERDIDAATSPLALLLQTLWLRSSALLGMAPERFIDWLEVTAPTAVSADAGMGASDNLARLADTMDELDAVLMTSLEEAARIGDTDMVPARAERHLADVWRRTFSAVAASEEAWLEQAFIRRGVGIVSHLYTDPDERRRLYQYGFPPLVGRRFEAVVPKIRELIAEAESYGSANATVRVNVFRSIGELLERDRGFGFRVRHTVGDQAILERWGDVLGWWMNEPAANEPSAESLRAWQRFVTDNLEFRLGVAIGAVVARAWSEGAADPFAVPSLASWKDTTGLPWFAFWARELLRWGTHDPFVAFCLARGLEQTRDAAEGRRGQYDSWLANQFDAPSSEDRIDPQLFLRWHESLQSREEASVPVRQFNARLTGTTGEKGRYAVVPVSRGAHVAWLDPAGFELAITDEALTVSLWATRSDYELNATGTTPTVARVFRPS